ncbi:MAG TPA: c-type cytochrome [Aliidongia sp.]|nr:c-type cytochrome [Aliidongia sp.]
MLGQYIALAIITVAAAGLPATALAGDAPAGDALAGQRDFSRCAACHAAEPGKNRIGPSLAGVVGRSAGGVPDYSYSTAMKNAHLTWDAATIDRFLANPQSVVRGTKMFVDVPDATARANVIAYLATLR